MNFLRQLIFYVQSFILALMPMPTYVEGVIGQPSNFFPSHSTNQIDRTVSKLIFRGLFKYDIYGEIQPDLAETWTISEDGLNYTIKLKDNQYWSDGSKINSNDLIYTSFKVPDLAGVATDKIDNLTIRYTLPNKFSPFLSLLTIGVMQSNSEETQAKLLPVSSGPFKVLRVEKNGPITKQVVLVKDLDETVSDNNVKYCIDAFVNPQTGTCKLRKVIFRYYQNEDELELAAKLGEIDGFLANNEVSLQNFENVRFPTQGVYYSLFFNLRNEKFKDILFRQKLERALPIEQIISSRGITVQGPVSRSSYTDRSLVDKKFDPNLREDLSDISVTITVPDVKNLKEMAEEVKKAWKDKFEMDVTIQKVNPVNFSSTVIEPRNFEILLYGQEVGRDPDRYVNWHSTQASFPGLNLSGFSQVRADRALEEGRNEIDPDKRTVHYHEFQKVVAEQVPVIFLNHPYTNYYISRYIKGVGEKYTFDLTDRFLDFDNWERIISN